MAPEYIYDGSGRTIGWTVTQVNGDVYVYNATGRMLGFASQASGKTFNEGGAVVSFSFAPLLLLHD
jgi:hypothetical protein